MPKKLKLGYRKKSAAKGTKVESPSEAVADNFVAEGAPDSPPKPGSKALTARVPPSPGKQQVNGATMVLKWAKQDAHAMFLEVGAQEKAFEVAKNVFHAKLGAIERATRPGKKKQITPRQELNRLWMAERSLQKAHVVFVLVREEAAKADCRAADAMIELLQLKLRRMSRVGVWWQKKRGLGLASPTARFKFGLRK